MNQCQPKRLSSDGVVLYLIAHNMTLYIFLHDRPWISPWIKSISNELDIIIQVMASQLSQVIVTSSGIDYDVIRTTKSVQVRHRDDVYWSSFLSSFVDSLNRVRSKIIYVLSWRTISALARVLFWCLFPSLLRRLKIHYISTIYQRHSNYGCFLITWLSGRFSLDHWRASSSVM